MINKKIDYDSTLGTCNHRSITLWTGRRNNSSIWRSLSGLSRFFRPRLTCPSDGVPVTLFGLVNIFISLAAVASFINWACWSG